MMISHVGPVEHPKPLVRLFEGLKSASPNGCVKTQPYTMFGNEIIGIILFEMMNG